MKLLKLYLNYDLSLKLTRKKSKDTIELTIPDTPLNNAKQVGFFDCKK